MRATLGKMETHIVDGERGQMLFFFRTNKARPAHAKQAIINQMPPIEIENKVHTVGENNSDDYAGQVMKAIQSLANKASQMIESHDDYISPNNVFNTDRVVLLIWISDDDIKKMNFYGVMNREYVLKLEDQKIIITDPTDTEEE